MAQAMALTCSSPTTLCSFASPARCTPHSSTPQKLQHLSRKSFVTPLSTSLDPSVVCLRRPIFAIANSILERALNSMALASASANSLLGCSQPPSLTIKLHTSPSRQVWQRKSGLFVNATSAGTEDSIKAPGSWSIQHQVKPRVVAVRSKDGDETEAVEVTEAPKPAISERRAKAEAEVAKGQRTAIVTGAISVLLGVGYLVLIQLLDTRGVILVPPPPEAFNP